MAEPCSQMLYASTGYVDELAWAAAWLFKATGNQQYLTDAKTYYAKVSRWQFSRIYIIRAHGAFPSRTACVCV